MVKAYYLFIELYLRATGCHLPLWKHSVTCHPKQENTPCLKWDVYTIDVKNVEVEKYVKNVLHLWFI